MTRWMTTREARDYLENMGVDCGLTTVRQWMDKGLITLEQDELTEGGYRIHGTTAHHVLDALENGRIPPRMGNPENLK